MPIAETELHYDSPFHLLIAVILSAQCTDKRVNMTTPAIFEAYPDAGTLANASYEDLFQLVRSISYPNNKTRHLIGMAQKLVTDFGGVVPSDIDELMSLPGVGRKTANLVCGDIYGRPAVVADTHFIRLCRRMGFTDTSDPLKIEKEMRALLPPDKSNNFCHRAVIHGRSVCTARKAHCESCCLNAVCNKNI